MVLPGVGARDEAREETRDLYKECIVPFSSSRSSGDGGMAERMAYILPGASKSGFWLPTCSIKKCFVTNENSFNT